MTIEKAFDELLKNWDGQSKEFKAKYHSYRSHYVNGTHTVGLKIKREMLLKAGWKENYSLHK